MKICSITVNFCWKFKFTTCNIPYCCTFFNRSLKDQYKHLKSWLKELEGLQGGKGIQTTEEDDVVSVRQEVAEVRNKAEFGSGNALCLLFTIVYSV